MFQELHGYASVRDPETGIEVRSKISALVSAHDHASLNDHQAGPYERIWKADSLIPSDLRDKLIAAVHPLENVPDAEKDWHPRSDNQVLDLVHPSLYPIVYDRTLANDRQTDDPLKHPNDRNYYVSKKFQWLPSDFVVREDGSVALTSPYINNIDPKKHAALESVVPKLLERAVPLWERVLSDLSRPLLPLRVCSHDGIGLPDCVFDYDNEPDGEEAEEHEADMDAWLSTQNPNLPDAREYTEDLVLLKTPTVSLKGTTIQCIIKLANIILTPEKPEYPGGKWHIEGQSDTIFLHFDYNG